MSARWEAGMFMSLRFLFSFSAFACCSWSGRKSEKGEEGMSQWLDYNCSKSLWSSAKRSCFTVHLLSAVCSLGLEVWMGFFGSSPFQCFAQCPQSGRWTRCWTCTQYSIKWPRLPFCLGPVALVSSGVMEGQSCAASPVITGSWHSVSTAAKSCTEILELQQHRDNNGRRVSARLPGLQDC